MTDWASLKVADLKEELKSRGIPLTGLKLKQHFIDKLVEVDTQSSQPEGPHEPSSEEPSIAKDEDASSHKDQQAPVEISTEDAQKPLNETRNSVPKAEQQVSAEHEADVSRLTSTDPAIGPSGDGLEGDSAQPSLPTASEHVTEPPNDQTQEPTAAIVTGGTAPVALESKREPESIPTQPTHSTTSTRPESTRASPPSTPSTVLSATEVVEDTRKRKRRSVTPPPSTVEVALKRARARDGTPVPTKTEARALEEVQKATNEAEQSRLKGGDQPPSPTAPPGVYDTVESGTNRDPLLHKVTNAEPPDIPDKVLDIAPARHLPTTSLYIRNFKRPLNLPVLRQHVTTLAKTASNDVADPNEDPVERFYLDAIRTHAFISFTSIPAANAVRQAMHNLPFPNEPGRDALFIDFIPSHEVESWIKTEESSGSRIRFEIVYEDVPDGAVAIHQEARPGRQQPQAQPTRPTPGQAVITGPNPQVRVDPPVRPSSTGPVHPSRATRVPQDSIAPNLTYSHTKPSNHHSTAGTGFKALDELFSSTRTAKPKLYYKAVPPRLADERLDMIHHLRGGHAEMGRSGDEGMKRYSFEMDRGREEWVDKGPEFGFGRKGVDRLAGRSVKPGAGAGVITRGRSYPYTGPRVERGNDHWR